MIKNLLWKQALELAKKKFGNLNTNQANKWLVDKYNALLGKENTKNIANKIREDLKRDRPFEGFKPEVVPPQVVPTPKKFNPFKKEGKKIDFMDYLAKRKRGEFDDGGIILPQPKPYNFEEKIEFLKKIKSGVGPKTYLQLMSHYLNEGVEKGAISKSARDNFLKGFTGTISEDWTSAIDDENLYMYEGDYERYPPKKFDEGGLAGMLGETQPQQVGYAADRTKIVKELYDKAGGFEGTGKTFEEFMADVLFEGDYLAKGGRVGLGEGDTPSEAYLRDIFYDKFDHIGIPFDVWKNSYHATPWKEKWLSENRAEGGRAGYLKGGLLRTGIMEALDQFILKGKNPGDYAINMGDVRKLFQDLDQKFAGKITSKESIDDVIKRFRDTRKLDLSESIKEFLNNRIKQYKSGLENIKKYGQSGSIEEVGDHAEELRYLIKETRKDLDAIDKYGLTQQSKKATKHAEGGIVGLKNGGLLEKYKEYAPKGPWTKGLTDMEITYELYNLLEPYMSLFMKEGGRVGFKEGKGMTRRAFLKLLGGAAALPIVGKYFKLAKPAAKVMDDIRVSLRGDGDWENIDGMWSGNNWVNYSFEALTDKGRKILTKLTKGKNASLVDQGDGVYFPGKVVKSKSHVGGQYLTDEADHAVDAVDAIKKSKGNISLNTQVGKKTKGIDKSQITKNSTQNFKTYSSKNINKQTILDEVDDYYAHDMGGYSRKHFDDDSVEMILDILDTTKKAEGGRVGLYKGGIIDLLIKGGKFLNKHSPIQAYKKYLKSVKDRTLKANKTGKFTDLPLEVIPIASAGALVTNYLKKKLKSLDEKSEEKAEGGRITDYSFDDYMREREMLENMRREDQLRREFEEDMRRKKIREQKQWAAEGGRIGLDAGGPPISPANLHPLQRPMFYQGGLTKTVPPQRGPMPQGLQSNVYDGIMRSGVINGRN